jgi:hypothetical protein
VICTSRWKIVQCVCVSVCVAPTLRVSRLGSRGKAGAQQKEPSLEEGRRLAFKL